MSMETLQSVAKTRYGMDVNGAVRRGATNNGENVQGNTDLNGMARALWGPGTAQNRQTTEWPGMEDLIFFFLSAWPAP